MVVEVAWLGSWDATGVETESGQPTTVVDPRRVCTGKSRDVSVLAYTSPRAAALCTMDTGESVVTSIPADESWLARAVPPAVSGLT